MRKKKQAKNSDTPSLFTLNTTPENAFDQVNRYGTYNIQPTADSENRYPAIAQGLAKQHRKRPKNET